MAPERPTLVYDGSCGLCTDAARLVRRWDRGGRLDVAPFQDAALLARFGIAVPAYAAAIHLLLPDGRVFVGADAVPPLVRMLPGRRWLGWPWAVPGVPRLARRLYAAIAARRRCSGRASVDDVAAGSVGSPR
jgi:predicted DCC family thiol-disulfide oxidoreductase YuxK